MTKEPNDLNVENEIAAEGWDGFCGKLHAVAFPKLSDEEFMSKHGEALDTYLEEWRANIDNETVFLDSLNNIISGYTDHLNLDQRDGLSSLGVRQIIVQAIAWNQAKSGEPEIIRGVDDNIHRKITIAKYAGLALVVFGAAYIFASKTNEAPVTMKAYVQATKQPESTQMVQATAQVVEIINNQSSVLNIELPKQIVSDLENVFSSTIVSQTEVISESDFMVGNINFREPLKLSEKNGKRKVDVSKYKYQVVVVDSEAAWAEAIKVLENPNDIPGGQVVLETNTDVIFISFHSGETISGFQWPGEVLKSLTKSDIGSAWTSGEDNLRLESVFVLPKEVFAQAQRSYPDGSPDGKLKPGQVFIDLKYLAGQAGIELPSGGGFAVEVCAGDWDENIHDYGLRQVAIFSEKVRQTQSKVRAW